jgi:hypothetical protein
MSLREQWYAATPLHKLTTVSTQLDRVALSSNPCILIR